MGNLKIKVIRLVGVWLVLILAAGLGVVACSKAVDVFSAAVQKQFPKKDPQRIAYSDPGDKPKAEWSLQEWQKAKPEELLPSSGETPPGVGGELFFAPGILLPEGEAENLFSTAESFLREWETFSPGDTSMNSRIGPFVFSEQEERIASRVEADDPSGVCLSSDACWEGLVWPVGARAILRLNYQGNGWVLLQGWGTVAYKGGDPELQDRYLERRYGILLQQQSGKWLVVRAVAESGSII